MQESSHCRSTVRADQPRRLLCAQMAVSLEIVQNPLIPSVLTRLRTQLTKASAPLSTVEKQGRSSPRTLHGTPHFPLYCATKGPAPHQHQVSTEQVLVGAASRSIPGTRPGSSSVVKARDYHSTSQLVYWHLIINLTRCSNSKE